MSMHARGTILVTAISFAGVAGLLGANHEILSYRDAVQLALQNNPELHLAEADIRKASAEKIDSDHILPSNPDFEATYSRGTKAKSPTLGFSPSAFSKGEDPFDAPVTAITNENVQKTHGFELGITQEIDVWSKQKGKRDAADVSIQQSKDAHEISKLQTRIGVRNDLMNVSALDELINQSDASIRRLKKIRSTIGGGFVDPRLGAYAGTAFASDLAGLEADHRDLLEARLKSRLSLIKSIGAASANFEAPSPEKIPLPSPPPLDELLEIVKQNNPDMRSAELAVRKFELSEENAALAGQPNPSLFFGWGQNTIGNSNLGLRKPGPENEKETTVRFGIRIPLPVADRTKGERESAGADKAKAKAQLETVKSNLELITRLAHERYATQRAVIADLRNPGTNNLAAIDQAFVAGRISYFEFIGEYERAGKMIKRRADAFMSAAQSCGALELLAGRTFDQD